MADTTDLSFPEKIFLKGLFEEPFDLPPMAVKHPRHEMIDKLRKRGLVENVSQNYGRVVRCTDAGRSFVMNNMDIEK